MAKSKTKAPLETLSEPKYLRQLAASRTPVSIKMDTNEVFTGSIATFDAGIVRLSDGEGAERTERFLYKDDIKYLWEV
jgi:hypothetical protein